MFIFLGLTSLIVVKRQVLSSLYQFEKRIRNLEPREKRILLARFTHWNGEEIEGFAWSRNDQYIYLLNLRGIKKFEISEKSALFYFDICKNKNGRAQEGGIIEIEGPFERSKYKERLKIGDYIDLNLYEENGNEYIDKLWAYSGHFYLSGLSGAIPTNTSLCDF